MKTLKIYVWNFSVNCFVYISYETLEKDFEVTKNIKISRFVGEWDDLWGKIAFTDKPWKILLRKTNQLWPLLPNIDFWSVYFFDIWVQHFLPPNFHGSKC